MKGKVLLWSRNNKDFNAKCPANPSGRSPLCPTIRWSTARSYRSMPSSLLQHAARYRQFRFSKFDFLGLKALFKWRLIRTFECVGAEATRAGAPTTVDAKPLATRRADDRVTSKGGVAWSEGPDEFPEGQNPWRHVVKWHFIGAEFADPGDNSIVLADLAAALSLEIHHLLEQAKHWIKPPPNG
jgi:hypothetical protein